MMPITDSPAMWADETRQLYEEEPLPQYIKELESPYRLYYPTNQSRRDEMFRTLVEVRNNLPYIPAWSILVG